MRKTSISFLSVKFITIFCWLLLKVFFFQRVPTPHQQLKTEVQRSSEGSTSGGFPERYPLSPPPPQKKRSSKRDFCMNSRLVLQIYMLARNRLTTVDNSCIRIILLREFFQSHFLGLFCSGPFCSGIFCLGSFCPRYFEGEWISDTEMIHQMEGNFFIKDVTSGKLTV